MYLFVLYLFCSPKKRKVVETAALDEFRTMFIETTTNFSQNRKLTRSKEIYSAGK